MSSRPNARSNSRGSASAAQDRGERLRRPFSGRRTAEVKEDEEEDEDDEEDEEEFEFECEFECGFDGPTLEGVEVHERVCANNPENGQFKRKGKERHTQKKTTGFPTHVRLHLLHFHLRQPIPAHPFVRGPHRKSIRIHPPPWW